MSSPGSWQQLRDELDALLALPAPERSEALARLAAEDPARARELAELLEAARGDDFLAASALDRLSGEAPAPPAPERIGPWRLEAEIGRGGMGTVWRGRRDDGAYDQVVAIKLVRTELFSDLTGRRLAAERRILARLAHPAIARLLDGGSTVHGTPYLVLEHVEGERIDLWCDRRSLPLAGRLRLFVEVCEAVDFAHRQLVLHRDLKTANILVDAGGRPKLLDFGIAKLLDPGEEEEWTSLGLPRPLTPGWASPEQLRAEPLTTASDVYSLGILLCVLTAGRPPHRSEGTSPAELARRIEQAGRIRLPSLASGATAPGVDAAQLGGDLERIAAKALDPDPGARYQTAAGLAADVERLLAGRPVEAHPPSLTYRLRKFVRRRAVPVTLVTVATLALVLSGVVSIVQARRAERESQRAARRLEEVRELAGRFLFDFELALRDLAGSTALREQVVSTALRYLELLAVEAGDDPSLLDDLAQGYVRVGEIQGSPYLPNLGEREAAAASAGRALELARRLVELTPRSATAHRRLSLAHQLAGDLAADASRPSDAVDAYQRSIEEARLALDLAPGDTELRRLLGSTLQRLASSEQARGRFDAAIRGLAESLAQMEELAAADPGRFRRNVVIGRTLLGQAQLEAGRPAEALESQRAALTLAEELVAANPGSPGALRDFSAVADRAILALLAAGEAHEAMALAERSLEVSRKLGAADPDNVLGRFDLTASWHQLGRCALASGEPERALDAFASSLEIARLLTRVESGNALFRQALVDAHWGLAEAEDRLGHGAEAAAHYEAARRELADLVELAPEEPALAERLRELDTLLHRSR